MDVVVIHGNGTEWEDNDEEITCGDTTSRRYENIHGIIELLVAPGCPFDYTFFNTLLLCLPSISSPQEFFNCLSNKMYIPHPNRDVMEQIQMKVLIAIRYWSINPCAYADMSTGSLLDNIIELMKDINKKAVSNGISVMARKIKEQLKHIRSDLRAIDRAQVLYRARVMEVQASLNRIISPNVRVSVSSSVVPPSRDKEKSSKSRPKVHEDMNVNINSDEKEPFPHAREKLVIITNYEDGREASSSSQSQLHSNGSALSPPMSAVNMQHIGEDMQFMAADDGECVREVEGDVSIILSEGMDDEEDDVQESNKHGTDAYTLHDAGADSRDAPRRSLFSDFNSENPIEAMKGDSVEAIPYIDQQIDSLNSSFQEMDDEYEECDWDGNPIGTSGESSNAHPNTRTGVQDSSTSEVVCSEENFVRNSSNIAISSNQAVFDFDSMHAENNQSDSRYNNFNYNALLSANEAGLSGAEGRLRSGSVSSMASVSLDNSVAYHLSQDRDSLDKSGENGLDKMKKSFQFPGSASAGRNNSGSKRVGKKGDSSASSSLFSLYDTINSSDATDTIKPKGQVHLSPSKSSKTKLFQSTNSNTLGNDGSLNQFNKAGATMSKAGTVHSNSNLRNASPGHGADVTQNHSPVSTPSKASTDSIPAILNNKSSKKGTHSEKKNILTSPGGNLANEINAHIAASCINHEKTYSNVENSDEEEIHSPRKRVASSGTVGSSVSVASSASHASKTRLSHSKLAVMLTVLEYEDGLLSIRPREFINLAWSRKDLKTIHPDLGGAATLAKHVYNTNQRIGWIAREIINFGLKSSGIFYQVHSAATKGTDNATIKDTDPAIGDGDYSSSINVAKRNTINNAYMNQHQVSSLKHSTSECIEFYLKVAIHCLKLNNFNTVFQIVAALGMPAIRNLKAAWSSLASNMKVVFRSLLELCNPKNNYINYRLRLDELKNTPKIPSIQVMIRDVTLLENTSGEWRRGGYIDLKKAMVMTEKIAFYLACQRRILSKFPISDATYASIIYNVEITSHVNAGGSGNGQKSVAASSDSNGYLTNENVKALTAAVATPNPHNSNNVIDTPPRSLSRDSTRSASYRDSDLNSSYHQGSSGLASYRQYLRLSRDSYFEPFHEAQLNEPVGVDQGRRTISRGSSCGGTSGISLSGFGSGAGGNYGVNCGGYYVDGVHYSVRDSGSYSSNSNSPNHTLHSPTPTHQNDAETAANTAVNSKTPKKAKKSFLSPLASFFGVFRSGSSSNSNNSAASHKGSSARKKAAKYTLVADDLELATLQQYIQCTSIDNNALWNDSLVVNDIEFRKLKMKLSRAGLF